MSFETLIWLGLTLLFVLAPMFGNKNRKKPDGGAPGQQPPAAQKDDGSPVSQFESRLEEARRRIEAASREQQASTQAGQQTRQQPVSRPQTAAPQRNRAQTRVQPGNRPQTRQQSTGRQPQNRLDWQQTGIDWQAGPTRRTGHGDALANSKRASEERARRLKAASTELQVTRLAAGKTYTGRRERVDAGSLFGRKSVLSGYIWHQILSEPPHKGGARRRVSRLRSP